MNLQTIDNALKNIYLDVIAEHLNTAYPFLSMVEHAARDVWGKNIRKYVRWGDKYAELSLELVNLYGTIELSEKALRASENCTSAFVNLLNSEIEDMIKETKNNMCKQLFDDGGMSGFSDIFKKDGVIYGLDRADYPQLIPYIQEDFGELTEGKLFEVIDRFENTPNFIITTYEIAQYIKRIGYYDTIELSNGSRAFNWNGIVVLSDLKCPKDTMYILNSRDFTLHQLCDWTWLESEDGKILRQVPNKPVYTATLVKYANLICDNPSNQAMLTGVSVNKENDNGQ